MNYKTKRNVLREYPQRQKWNRLIYSIKLVTKKGFDDISDDSPNWFFGDL